MSYILEALKKAQAERQLGELPTIHAAQVHTAAGGGGARKPAWLPLAVLASLAALAALVWVQPWRAPLVPVTVATAPVPVPAPPALPAAPALPVAPEAPALPLPAASVPAPPAVASARMAALARVPARPSVPSPARAPVAPRPAPTPAPAPVPEPAATDDGVLTMRELPEPIQRQIPQLGLGGYLYSKNPAERVLLVDKILRHEGEELAPGLTLEKLQPKAAVFNYKGYRYRVAY